MCDDYCQLYAHAGLVLYERDSLGCLHSRPVADKPRQDGLPWTDRVPGTHGRAGTRAFSDPQNLTKRREYKSITSDNTHVFDEHCCGYTQAPNKDNSAAPQISMIADARKPAIRVGSVTSAQQDRQMSVYDTYKRRKHDSHRHSTSKYDDGNQSRDNDC